MKVLCKLNSGVIDVEEDGGGEWPFSLSPWLVPFSFSGLSLLVSLTGGVGRTTTAAAVPVAAAIPSSALLLSDLTSDESRRALVLLANTPKSIKVDASERRTSHTLTVQTFSRKEILCKAWMDDRAGS